MVCLLYYIYMIFRNKAPNNVIVLSRLSFIRQAIQVRPTPWLHNQYSGTRVHSNHVRYMMHLHANKFGAFNPVYQCQKLVTEYLKPITVLDNQLTRSAGCLITDSLASPSSDIISCSNMIAPCSLITIRYGSHRVACVTEEPISTGIFCNCTTVNVT